MLADKPFSLRRLPPHPVDQIPLRMHINIFLLTAYKAVILIRYHKSERGVRLIMFPLPALGMQRC